MALMDPTSVILLVTGLVAFAWMILGLARGISRGSAVTLLVPFALFSLGWYAAELLVRMQVLGNVRDFDTFALARIGLYCLLAQAVFFFQLTREVDRHPASGYAGWITGIVFLAAAALLYENPLRLVDYLPVSATAGISRTLAAFTMIVAGWAVFTGASALITIRAYRRETVPLHRNRRRYWALAILIEAAAQICMLARQPMAGALLHVFAGSIVTVVLRVYHLPDLRSAARRISVYLVTVLVCAGLYVGVYYGIQSALGATRGMNPVVVATLLAVFVALLFHPLVNSVQRFIQRWMLGTRYDARQLVSQYSQSISNILDMERLAAAALSQIREALEFTHGALIVANRDDQDSPSDRYILRPITGTGEERAEVYLSANNPVVTSWQREHTSLTQYDIDVLPRYQTMERSERQRLAELQMDVFIPIYAQQQWIGLLALGPRATGERYYDEDLDLLQTLADQTAVGLENARLYANLILRNAENERLNAELQQANTELSRLDQAKSDFINIASHELRTPLTQVIGYNDILAEMIRANSISQNEAASMSDAVRRAARRLEEIVETMFDVSRLEARTLDLSCAPVSLLQVINEAVRPWANGIEQRRLVLTMKEIQKLPAVFADGKRLTQVFTHIIQNAIKSTPDGGQIMISGRLMEKVGGENTPGFVEITVEDTGIGIPPEELERIFIKFYRVGNVLLHSSGETKFKGAGPGLGLTIARGIVEAHGGRIWAESLGFDEKTLPGAKFHVVLPIETIPRDAQHSTIGRS